MAATTFTVGSGNIVRPYVLAGRLIVKTFPEGASQTFVAGEPLILNTGSHKGAEVVVASNDPTSAVVGIAVHKATGVEGQWTGNGSRTDSQALAAGAYSSLGPGEGGSLGQHAATPGITGGLTNGVVQVYLATENTLFIGHVISGQAISADDIGQQYGFEKDATNKIWRVDNGDTGNKVVQIVDLFDADGDINGRYIFKFVAAVKGLYGER